MAGPAADLARHRRPRLHHHRLHRHVLHAEPGLRRPVRAMTRFGAALPPRATRGEVSAKRTEGSWGGAGSVEASVHFGSEKRLIDGLDDDLGPNQHVIVAKADDSKPA